MVSAIVSVLRDSSSMLLEVAVAAVVCSNVAETSCSAAFESLVEESATSPCKRDSTLLRRCSIALNAAPSTRISLPPLGLTRTVRSPASAWAATRDSVVIGRIVSLARKIAKPTTSNAPPSMMASVRRPNVYAGARPAATSMEATRTKSVLSIGA